MLLGSKNSSGVKFRIVKTEKSSKFPCKESKSNGHVSEIHYHPYAVRKKIKTKWQMTGSGQLIWEWTRQRNELTMRKINASPSELWAACFSLAESRRLWLFGAGKGRGTFEGSKGGENEEKLSEERKEGGEEERRDGPDQAPQKSAKYNFSFSGFSPLLFNLLVVNYNNAQVELCVRDRAFMNGSRHRDSWETETDHGTEAKRS